MPRLLIPALGLTMAGFGVATASAQTDPVITIPIDTVVFAEPDTLTVVATTTVDPSLVGTTCGLVVEADNNSSVHPGNDLLVQSGSGRPVVLADVEGDEGRITFGSGPLTLGPVITVTLRMGEDGVFSAGFSVECRATPPTSTTTTTTTSTSTSTSTTTSTSMPVTTSPTTTSVAPPVSISTTSAPATTVAPPTVSPSTTAPPVTSSTTATRVLPRVQEAPPADSDEATPSFVG